MAQPDALRPFSVLVISTSWWAFPSRVAMVFDELGWHVEAMCWYGHPLSYTRAVRHIHRYRPMRPLAGLSAAIERAAPDLLVPCDDRAVAHLQALHDQFCANGRSAQAALIARSLGAPRSTALVRQRAAFIDLARQEGLRAPPTFAVDSEVELHAALGRIGLPAVLKVDDTWGGLGVARVDTVAQAEQMFARMTRPLSAVRAVKRLLVNRDPFSLRPWAQRTRPRVNVQGFVAGQPATCVVACWNGEVLAAIHADVLRTQSAMGASTTVRIVDHVGMHEAARRMVRRLGLSGFCGLDFLIDDTGDLHLLEMNQRMTPLGHLSLGEGRDPIAAVAARATDRPMLARPPMTTQDVVAFFPQAWLFDPDSPDLMTAYHDVPWTEPDLVRELVRLPWPERGWLARRTGPRPVGVAAATRPLAPVSLAAPCVLRPAQNSASGSPHDAAALGS